MYGFLKLRVLLFECGQTYELVTLTFVIFVLVPQTNIGVYE